MNNLSMTDSAAALHRIDTLIASGRHRDEVPGRSEASSSHGGAFRDGRRLYYRGSDAFSLAETQGRLDRLPPPPPPASRVAIEEAEALAGAPLPEFVKDLYAVANGGFGPGHGLLGLRDGFTDDMGRTAVDILTEVPRGLWPGMPSGLLPLCHWGCAIYSFVHCPSGQIFGWDPNPVEAEDDVPFFSQEYFVAEWIEAWLDGSLQQPWLIHEPGSATYRGATIEETRLALSEGTISPHSRATIRAFTTGPLCSEPVSSRSLAQKRRRIRVRNRRRVNGDVHGLRDAR